MILVTGGAGYIGSHMLHRLVSEGRKCVTLDDLSAGHRWAVPKDVPLIVGSTGDAELVTRLIRDYKIDSVVHFAASLAVGESVEKPIHYYRNNFVNSLQLIDCCDGLGVKSIVFSSTCATYGNVTQVPVTERATTRPLSPYGHSKLMTEQLLGDLERSGRSRLKHVILRYFNVAGAKVGGGLGQATPSATQLIKVAAEAACGKRSGIQVFGTDYPTPDGTCIRDYIHVDDLVDAHLLALDYLAAGGQSDIFNCGYGSGFSVLEVLAMMKKVSGVDFPVTLTDRRAGDAVAIYADPSKIKTALGWKPRYADLELICRTAYNWERECTG